MQEEVENRAVTLVISATKLTARLLKAVILKYLASRKEKKLAKARGAPEKPTGKQTVKQLVGQNQGVSNIEVTERNIKGFDRGAQVRRGLRHQEGTKPARFPDIRLFSRRGMRMRSPPPLPSTPGRRQKQRRSRPSSGCSERSVRRRSQSDVTRVRNKDKGLEL